MCGILALLGKSHSHDKWTRQEFLSLLKLLIHRGPDWTGLHWYSPVTDFYFEMANANHSLGAYEYPPSFKGLIAMGHQRLSIVGLQSGEQPITSTLDNGFTLTLAVNGEIYNYKQLRRLLEDEDKVLFLEKMVQDRTQEDMTDEECQKLHLQCQMEVESMEPRLYSRYQYQTDSDCESINHLFSTLVSSLGVSGHMSSISGFFPSQEVLNELVQERLDKLDGVFSFILTITHPRLEQPFFLIARDPIGVNPLYYGLTKDDEVMVASEMKGIQSRCTMVADMLPGHFISGHLGSEVLEPIPYYFPKWDIVESSTSDLDILLPEIRDTLTKAVRKRLMSEVPSGVLLSGGLDSSLIASIASRELKMMGTTEWGNQLRTFSIGLEGSPDLEKAQEVANFLGSCHHSFTFTLEEGLDAIKDVIYHLETYDITTIRASTPMFLLSRKIKAYGVKMVLSGEGSDEILGGYLYFHHAPNDKEFLDECRSRVKALYKADCLRANKSTMAWGLEVRVPFLDKEFLELAIPIPGHLKMKARTEGGKRVEKWILREAFNTPSDPYLPEDLLWRQKEQFSDGVGYSWIDTLIAKTSQMVTDREMKMASLFFPYQTPTTKEAFYFRKLFEEMFPRMEHLTSKWIPRTDWEGVKSSDPSGRVYEIHENKKVDVETSSPRPRRVAVSSISDCI